MTRRVFAAVAAWVVGLSAAGAADPAPKKLLLVTHSGGFIHDSVGTAEQVLKEVGPKYGFDVTCFRYTGEPDPKAVDQYGRNFRKATGLAVEPEHCGRVNKDTLKSFDAVLFFTTGNPLTDAEVADLAAWVKAGGAFAGTHCATDTLYNSPTYGDLIGGYFKGHPPGLQKVRLKVEAAAHPAAAPFTDGEEFKDEYYIFRDAPYSRDKLQVVLSIAPESFAPKAGLARADRDYAVAWCKEYGNGRVFYTALGHPKQTWHDRKFQDHLFGGLKWALKSPASAAD